MDGAEQLKKSNSIQSLGTVSSRGLAIASRGSQPLNSRGMRIEADRVAPGWSPIDRPSAPTSGGSVGLGALLRFF